MGVFVGSDEVEPQIDEVPPVLLGRLEMRRNRDKGGEPYLWIRCWCPACEREHAHGWDERFLDFDRLQHRVSGLHPRHGYYIGLLYTGSDREHNDRVIMAFLKAAAAFQKRLRRKGSLQTGPGRCEAAQKPNGGSASPPCPASRLGPWLG
jgi:hypothetical protein